MIIKNYSHLNVHIREYFKMIDDGLPVSDEILLARDKVLRDIPKGGDAYTDDEMVEECITYIEKWYYTVFPWEKFVIALIFTYKDDDVLYDEFFIMMGRGNGKNGFISGLSNFLQTKKHGIRKYGIDIIATSEDQAETSFKDVWETLDDNRNTLGKSFSKTKEEIISKSTRSYLKYRTNNAKSKDGLRPGCLIFDEVHAYENYDNIKVFTSALGKIPHARTFYITTDGNIRGAVIDDFKEEAYLVLKNELKDSTMMPLIWKLKDETEVDNFELHVKANPSLPYLPTLRKEIKKAMTKSKTRPQIKIEMLTKRFNLPKEDVKTRVCEWEELIKTNEELPDLTGCECIGAVDFASIRDFVGCVLLFKRGGKYFVIHHTFICYKSLELESYNVDIDRAVEKGLCTILYTESIQESDVANWFAEMGRKYYIKTIVCDTYRASVLRAAFQNVALELKEIRNGSISHNKVAPLVEKLFADNLLFWGDDLLMRWYTWNVYTDQDRKGNTGYYKIEPVKRKTDGFFALLGALGEDENLLDSGVDLLSVLSAITV